VLEPADDETGLVAFVVCGVDAYRLPLLALRPEVLAHARTVVGDHRVRGLEDRRGGAVVLLELDHRRAGEVLLELLDVLDAGAAPAVDRLVVVADDERYARAPRQQPQPGVLDRVARKSVA